MKSGKKKQLIKKNRRMFLKMRSITKVHFINLKLFQKRSQIWFLLSITCSELQRILVNWQKFIIKEKLVRVIHIFKV